MELQVMGDSRTLALQQQLHERLRNEQRPVLESLAQPGLTILNAVPGSLLCYPAPSLGCRSRPSHRTLMLVA